MTSYQILPGLPPYGSEALPFSSTGQGMHSEGLVVRFLPDTLTSWVGNFQLGTTNLTTVIPHPDGKRLIVIAGGQGYVIFPGDPTSWSHFGGCIDFAQSVPALDALALGDGFEFELLGSEAIRWRTRRISWDGMRALRLHGLTLTGQAWSYDETWHDFTVDLLTGAVVGGAYP